MSIIGASTNVSVFHSLFNGTAGTSLADAKLEGLHYVYISKNELYQFTVPGIHIAECNFIGSAVTQADLDSRYAQGLLAAPSTTAYKSVRDEILAGIPTGPAGRDELANFIAQVCVAACICTGTKVARNGTKASEDFAVVEGYAKPGTSPMKDVLESYAKEFPKCIDINLIHSDVLEKMSNTLGFEATNEAYASFFHTNHHNGASARFENGILYAYAAAQKILGVSPVPAQGVSIQSNYAGKSSLVEAIMRTAIHDTNHRGRAELVYGSVPNISFPVTDHNRFSYSNAPAGVSHVSGALAILTESAALIHASYGTGLAALVTVVDEVDKSQGLARFKYSPFYNYLTGTQPSALPSACKVSLSDAGALSEIAQDANYNTALTFLGGSAFNAVAIRKWATAGARAKAKRYLDILRSIQATRTAVTANDPRVQNAMTTAIANEIQGLVI